MSMMSGSWMRPLAIVGGLMLLAAMPYTTKAASCLNGLKPVLKAGGFSGSTDCLHDHLTIRNIGEVAIGLHRYSIQDYRYILSRACRGCEVHVGQRIIILDRGRYIGQYKPNQDRVTVKRHSLLFNNGSETFTATATRHGFPKETLVDGEIISFFR